MAHLAASSRNCHSLLHNEKARISYKHEVLQGSHLLLAPCGKWELLVAECFVLVLLQVRLSLASLQSAYQPQEVREKGLLTLVALTLPAFNECQDVSEDLRDILGKAARRTADTSQRLLVFRALWSAAAVCQSPELFFGNALIWATILQGLKTERYQRERVLNVESCSGLRTPFFIFHPHPLKTNMEPQIQKNMVSRCYSFSQGDFFFRWTSLSALC